MPTRPANCCSAKASPCSTLPAAGRGAIASDHYVGYLAAEALAAPIAPTHRVEMIEAMLHSAPDAASGGPAVLPRGALVMGEVQGEWLATAHGSLPLAALAEVATEDDDAADLAEQWNGAPS